LQNEYEVGGGEVRLWIEQESIHLKAVSAYGDPVELTKAEALQLAAALIALGEQLDC
jgi:hypothetical protein